MNDSDENQNNGGEEQAESVEESQAADSIGGEVDDFRKQIDSLAETLPLTILAIQVGHDFERKKFDEFIDKHCHVEIEGGENDSDENKYISVPPDYAGHFSKLQGRLEKALLAYRIVPRSFVVSLVSQYDALLGGLIRNILLAKPDLLSASEKNITFSQLVEFGSIENAREYIVEKEVETVLRKSHSEQFDWLQNKLGLELRKGLDVWPTFIEVTERRNLFVHNRGIVSNHYLDVCRKHGVTWDGEPQVGEELRAPRHYFGSAYEAVFEIGVKLAHVLWRKVLPEERKTADGNLITVGFDLLSEERFDLARKVLDFSATTLKTFSTEQNRLIFVINRAQAFKWSGDMETAKKILSAEDWSARSDDFKLAEAVLLDDFDKADEIVKRIGADGVVTKMAYREWPLFREYRKSEAFQRTFEEIFHEPLSLFNVTTSDSEDTSDDGSENGSSEDNGPAENGR